MAGFFYSFTFSPSPSSTHPPLTRSVRPARPSIKNPRESQNVAENLVRKPGMVWRNPRPTRAQPAPNPRRIRGESAVNPRWIRGESAVNPRRWPSLKKCAPKRVRMKCNEGTDEVGKEGGRDGGWDGGREGWRVGWRELGRTWWQSILENLGRIGQ